MVLKDYIGSRVGGVTVFIHKKGCTDDTGGLKGGV